MALTQHGRQLRDGIVEALRASLPTDAVPTVVHHDGVADVDFVKRYAIVAPALVLTILGGKCGTYSSGTLRDELQVGVYVITKGDDQERRTAEAIVLREHVNRVVLQWKAQFHPDGHDSPPKETQSNNLFDGKVDDLGVTIWAISWKHELDVPVRAEDEDLDAFERFWVEIFNPGEVESTPETGNALTEQQIELEQDP